MLEPPHDYHFVMDLILLNRIKRQDNWSRSLMNVTFKTQNAFVLGKTMLSTEKANKTKPYEIFSPLHSTVMVL